MTIIKKTLHDNFEEFWASFRHNGKSPKAIAKVAYMEGARDKRLQRAEELLRRSKGPLESSGYVDLGQEIYTFLGESHD